MNLLNYSRETAFSVIHWNLFSVKQPPDIIEEYITIDNVGDFKILEWYEGESFECCSGGHWRDEEGDEVSNIILWAKKPYVNKMDNWIYTKPPKDGSDIIVVIEYYDHVGMNVVKDMIRWNNIYKSWDGYLGIKIDDDIIKCWMPAPIIPSVLTNET